MTDNPFFDERAPFITHYPFVVLIDHSSSTGRGSPPDIDQINNSVATIVDALKNPPPNSEIDQFKDNIDICFIKYNNDVSDLVPWTNIHDLAPPAALAPEGGTATGNALKYTFRRINDRYTHYKANGWDSGRCYVFHLTDGELNDIQPNTPDWVSLSEKIYKLGGAAGQSNVKVPILNFLSAHGSRGKGVELMKNLMGDQSVHDMTTRINSFHLLVEFIKATIGLISSGDQRTPEMIIKDILPSDPHGTGVPPTERT